MHAGLNMTEDVLDQAADIRFVPVLGLLFLGQEGAARHVLMDLIVDPSSP